MSLKQWQNDQKHVHKDVVRLSPGDLAAACCGQGHRAGFRRLPLVTGDWAHGLKTRATAGGLPVDAVCYIKRQWAWDRRLPRWSDWRDDVSGLPDPVREWQGLNTLQSIGLNVPTPLRLWQDSRSGSARAALIMTAVPGERSLTDWFQSGDIGRLSPFERRGLIVVLAEMVNRIHGNGFRWRSMKAKHVYPVQLPNRRWQLWLIDCEGVRPRATRRQQRRDRRLLLRSLQSSGADAAFLSAARTALLTPPSRRTVRSRVVSRLPYLGRFAVAADR